jgi:hypothetical protein
MPIPTSYAQARAEVERLVQRFAVLSAHNCKYWPARLSTWTRRSTPWFTSYTG